MKIEDIEKLCDQPGCEIDGKKFNIIPIEVLQKLLAVAKAAKRTDEICELINMGDETSEAIGEAQADLGRALRELEKG